MNRTRDARRGLAVAAWMSLALPWPAASQSDPTIRSEGAAISGTVIAVDRAEPLVQALVTLVPLHAGKVVPAGGQGDGSSVRGVLSQTTGADGRYRFSGIPAGKYRLLMTREGYLPVVMEVVVGSRADLSLSATLELMPARLAPLSQDTLAIVSGRVTDAKSGEPVASVEITVEGTDLIALTDAEGRFWLVGVPRGPQTLRARRLGFAPARVPITVSGAGLLQQDISIAASALLVEGVTVTGDAVSRAKGEIATATVIDIESIRHRTATSLQGVLELVPGIEAQPPGLDYMQQIALRSTRTSGSSIGYGELGGGTSSEDLASFGTLIVLDGVPVSNNANLQSLGPRSELSFTTSAGGGVDIRKVPASTLERVEVIRGVPSARWGDLTQGAIIVDTRAGEVTPEVRLHADARTLEFSVVGGTGLGASNVFTTTFDYADSRSQPGVSDDRAYRFAAQLKHRIEVGSRWDFETGLDVYQLLDDRPPNPNVGREELSESRDRGFRVTERARWRLGPGSTFMFTGALSGVQQRSRSERSVVRTAMPFTDRIAEGRREGHYVMGEYVARVDVDGRPWRGYGRLEYASARSFGGLSHDLRAGLELTREWNSGAGYQFDIEFPPQVAFNGVNGYDRPRAFRDVPGVATSALYVDDRIEAAVGGVLLQMQAGARLDLLHEGDWWLTGARDAVLEPRLSLSVFPVPWLRVHGGWGKTAKTPPLGSLYPQMQYYDVVNVNYYTVDPAERLAILTTFTKDPANDELGFSRGTKAEVGVEFLIGRNSIALVAFNDRIDGGVGMWYDPASITRDHYALTDSTIGNGIKPEIIEPPERTDPVPVLVYQPSNVIAQQNRGLELIAFLPEIRPIRTRLHVTASYVETRQWSDALYFGDAELFSNFQIHEPDQRNPYWEAATEYGEQALATYRLIHHQPRAGLVISASLQHNITDLLKDVAATDTLAYLGYVTRDAELVPVPEQERGLEEYRDLRLPRSGLLVEPHSTPADWMLSVQVSKTLPLDGRLDFWAFNLLDKRGRLDVGLGALTRPYPKVRVGLEVSVPVRALLPWGYR